MQWVECVKTGVYQQVNQVKESLTVKEFKKLAQSVGHTPPEHTRDEVGYEDLERKYWRNMTYVKPLYGGDSDGSVTDPNQRLWNFQKLPSLLDMITEQNVKIMGVNTPYLYFGMWKATFAWHTEDVDLYSINYVHFGEPKSWYVIPPEHGKRFERVAKGYFPDLRDHCEHFLRHKMTIISPQCLKGHGIPVSKTVQRAGEMVVTFPYAYHQGFNHGYNCAEATNFATERWIEFGKWANHCSCREDAVKIDMDIFVQLYQPERYFNWRNGRDVNKVDFNKVTYPKRQSSRIHISITTSSSENGHKRKTRIESDVCEKRRCESTFSHKNSNDSNSSVEFLFEDLPSESDSTEVASNSEEHESSSVSMDDSLSVKCANWLTKTHCRIFWKKVKRKNRASKVQQMEERDKRQSVEQIVDLIATSCTFSYLMNLFTPLMKTTEPKSGIEYPREVAIQQTEHLRLASSVEDCKNVFDAFLSSSGNVSQPDSVNCSPIKPCFPEQNEASVSFKSCEAADSKTTLSGREFPNLGCNETDLQCPETLDSSATKMVSVGTDFSESWHSMISDMYHNQYSPSLSLDFAFNLSQAHIWPNCAVCSIFRDFYGVEAQVLSLKYEKIKQKYLRDGFDATKPLISDSVFSISKLALGKTAQCIGNSQFSPKRCYSEIRLDYRKPCPLLKCYRCRLSVHATCYGVTIEQFSADRWLCDPCKQHISDKFQESRQTSPACLLCPNKGGAYKKVTKYPLGFHRLKERIGVGEGDDWVHLTCAITSPEVFFTDLLHSSVDLSAVTKLHTALTCSVCSTSGNSLAKPHIGIRTEDDRVDIMELKSLRKDLLSSCIQCFQEFCTQAVHITCAHSSELWSVTPGYSPYTVKVYCKSHSQFATTDLFTWERRNCSNGSAGKHSLTLGCTVLVKRDRVHREGTLLAVKSQQYYRALFDEGTVSDDLVSEHLLGYDWAVKGTPKLNERVNILWEDEVYAAKFIGVNVVPLCEVVLRHDSSTVLVEEHELLLT